MSLKNVSGHSYKVNIRTFGSSLVGWLWKQVAGSSRSQSVERMSVDIFSLQWYVINLILSTYRGDIEADNSVEQPQGC